MAGQKRLSAEQLDEFHQQLRELRDGLIDRVDSGADAILGEMNPGGNLSGVPVHLGDAADGQSDADINVVESERDMLQDVQDALHRIDEGTFGTCVDCGGAIAISRLRVVPYTPYCIACANKHDAEPEAAGHGGGGRMKLTGFEAIEYAEKEDMKLNKSGDSIDAAVHGLSVAEAEAIASEDPDLIWLEIPSDQYGVRKNMKPGR